MGQILWAKSFGAVDSNLAHAWYKDDVMDITIDNAGNVYILGEANCSADLIFDTITVSNSQTPDMKNVFVAKFNSSGACKWVTVNSTNPNAQPNKIVVDNHQRVSITGGAYGSEVFGAFSLAHCGSYIATFDSIGTRAWAKSY